MKHFQSISLSHQHANLNEIGHVLPPFFADSAQLFAHLHELKKRFALEELFFLSTCNRILFISYSEKLFDGNALADFLHFFSQKPKEELAPIVAKFDLFEGKTAVQHLFKVAAGLDSMVVGEHEISTQVRKAIDSCKAQNLYGDNLRILFKTSIPLAKKIFNQTEIGRNSVSVVALAMHKLRQLQLPEQSRILMIGAGKTMQTAARFLKKMEFENVTIFNRTLQKATELATFFPNGNAATLSGIEQHEAGFDILISCIDAHSAPVSMPVFTSLLNKEPIEGKVLIDLAIPNNVTADVQALPEIRYINIEELKDLAEANRQKRRTAMRAANTLVEKEVLTFEGLYRQRQLERKIVRPIQEEMTEIKSRALNEIFSKEIADLSPDSQDLVERIAEYLTKKSVNIPIKISKQALSEFLVEKRQFEL